MTTVSSRASSICPWATATRASGTRSLSPPATWSMSWTRLWTKNTCPSRSSSRRMASATARSSYSPTKVRMGCRSAGGVSIRLRSRIPVNDISRVRGIGVAVRVRTSTSVRIALMDSLWATPKRCSSSMTRSPKSAKDTSPEISRWVPITTSTEPSARPPTTRRASCALRNRLRTSTRIG